LEMAGDKDSPFETLDPDEREPRFMSDFLRCIFNHRKPCKYYAVQMVDGGGVRIKWKAASTIVGSKIRSVVGDGSGLLTLGLLSQGLECAYTVHGITHCQ
jgi:hypothetical protein